MAEKIKRDYNIMSLDGTTDQEYVDLFGVPEELANTPDINKWLINDTYEKNLDLEYNKAIRLGRSEKEANAFASSVANKGRKQAWKNVHRIQKSRGYKKKITPPESVMESGGVFLFRQPSFLDCLLMSWSYK